MKRLLLTLLVAAVTLVFASPALAATTSLVGKATNKGTHVELVAGPTVNDFGNVQISNLNLTLGQLQTLSAEFNPTDDGCAAGSPRYTIILANGTAVHFAFGTLTNGTFTCTLNTWQNTGNLLTQFEGCRISSTGTNSDPCITQAELQALASQPISQILLVTDASWFGSPAFADNEQTVLVRNLVINTQTFFAPTTTSRAKLNAAKLCKAERTRMGTAAFNELWGTNGNDRNAFGKCVSTLSKAKATQTHQQILAAIASCQARGLKGAALGACVAAGDGVLPTLTEAQERAAGSSDKGKGKGKGKGKR